MLITPWFINLMLVSDQPIPYAEAANGKKRSVELPGGPGQLPMRRDRGLSARRQSPGLFGSIESTRPTNIARFGCCSLQEWPWMLVC